MMASAKTCDAVYHVDLPRTAKLLRELLYVIFYVTDHSTHFYALGGPDFVMGPDAPAAQRNILGVIHKVGVEIGRKVIEMRGTCHELIKMMAGRSVHPIGAVPGGMSKGMNREEREKVLKAGKDAVEFAKFTIGLFNQIVLGNKAYVDLILSDGFTHHTYNMGLVDEHNHVNFYDGDIRVTGPDGRRAGQVQAGRLPRASRGARRALVLPQVPRPPQDRLEGSRRRPGERHLQGDAALPAQRLRRDGDAPGQRRARPDVQDPGREARPSDAGDPLGPAGRAPLRGRALGGAGRRSRDHRPGLPRRPRPDPRRGRGRRRGAPGHALSSLQDR